MGYVQSFALYWIIVFGYICLVRFITGERITKSLARYLPLAILFQLIYWLIKFRVAIDIEDPFIATGRGPLYGLCAKAYFIIAISLFIIFMARMMRNFFKDRIGLTMYLPLFLLFLYLLYTLFIDGKYILLYFSLAVFAFAYILKPGHSLLVAAERGIKQFLDILLRKEFLIVIGLFLIAFAARYVWALRILSIEGDNFLRASDDGLTYAPFGVELAHGRIPGLDGSGLYWGGYGYWVFLSIIYRLFGDYNHYAMTFAQSILGALVPVCIFYITKKIFNKYVAIIAGGLTAIDMNLIFISVVICMEALWIPMVYISFLLLISYFQKPEKAKLLYALAIGIFLGFTNLARGEIIFFPLIIGFLAFMFFKKKIGTKRVLIIALVLIIGFSMPLMLHATKNYIRYGKFTFLSGQASSGFGLHDAWYGSIENKMLSEMGFNPFGDLRKSFIVFFDKPKEVTKLFFVGFCKRTYSFITVPNFGMFDPIIIVNPARGYVYHYPIYLLAFGHLFLLGGFILAFKNRDKFFEKSLLGSYLLYTTLIYAIIISTNARHKGVLHPLFYLFLAYGLYGAYRFIKTRLCAKE